jgi:hypothetical protein
MLHFLFPLGLSLSLEFVAGNWYNRPRIPAFEKVLVSDASQKRWEATTLLRSVANRQPALFLSGNQ